MILCGVFFASKIEYYIVPLSFGLLKNERKIITFYSKNLLNKQKPSKESTQVILSFDANSKIIS